MPTLWENSRMLTWSTAGESHGPALVALLEGMPAGVPLSTDVISAALARRRLGYGRGARQKFEQDVVRILAGVRHGFTTGAPIAIEIANTEWPKWETVMSADPVSAESLQVDAGRGDTREMARNRTLTRPRPGHADLAGMVSYNLTDARDVLERASARETAARVALGACANAYLGSVSDIAIVSRVVAVGAEAAYGQPLPQPQDQAALDNSGVRNLDPAVEARFVAAIDAAQAAGDTIGGVAEVAAWNLPIGLGSHVSGEQRLDARLAAALMGIQSVKAVEIGDGFAQASSLGSSAHDEILLDSSGGVRRGSNHAGGLEGGTTNGMPLVVRAGFKPISTVPKALRTVDLETGEESTAFHQRSDTCQVAPGAVIAEAMVALELARALDERLGGRSVAEARAHMEWYEEYCRDRLSRGSADGE